MKATYKNSKFNVSVLPNLYLVVRLLLHVPHHAGWGGGKDQQAQESVMRYFWGKPYQLHASGRWKGARVRMRARVRVRVTVSLTVTVTVAATVTVSIRVKGKGEGKVEGEELGSGSGSGLRMKDEGWS
jgi:hypothetical protein